MAGPTWKGSGDSAAGRSAWRSAASARAPWAVIAARARFTDSFSSVSRWAPDRALKPAKGLAGEGPACACEGGGSGGGAAAATGSGFGADLAVAFALAFFVVLEADLAAASG